MSRIVEEDTALVGNIRETAKEYIRTKRERAETAKKLYDEFLHQYVFQFSKDKEACAEELKAFFKKDVIRIAAIDGTLYKQTRRGCIAFYVLAVPLIYELDLNAQVCYRIEEETVKKNVMAIVPIPLSEVYLLGSTTARDEQDEAQRLAATEDAADASSEAEEDIGAFEVLKIGKIDVKLMKLAEAYALYWVVHNRAADVVMYDGSFFKDYAFSNRNADQINLHKGTILGKRLDRADFELFKALPISEMLGTPSPRFTGNFVTAEILYRGPITLTKREGGFAFQSALRSDLVSLSNVKVNNLRRRAYLDITERRDEVHIDIKPEYKDSFERLTDLFCNVCAEGFDHHNLAAFKIFLEHPPSWRYFAEEDLDTLCRIGYLLTIQACWASKTLLFSLIKDTTERLFIDYFLTVAGPRHLKVFRFNEKLLPRIPSTDAGMLFDIVQQTPELHPPLALMEHDPAASAVYSLFNPEKKAWELASRPIQEREFLRSFVQIAEMPSGRRSYVYTVDRLMYPGVDAGYKLLAVPELQYNFAYYDQPSTILRTIVAILTLTSSNKHDVVFGYPDPLFEADQYVKTVGMTHKETLDIALSEIDLDEFSVTHHMGRSLSGG